MHQAPSDDGSQPFVVHSTARLVEACARVRLPFEPREWQIEFRETLRQSIAKLDTASDELLHASYASSSREACDAENALIYNVGASCFAHPARYGLMFERGLVSVPDPGRDRSVGDHHYRYAPAVLDAEPRHWRTGRSLAQIETLGCGALTASTKVARVWQAVKSGVLHVSTPIPTLPEFFGVTLVLNCPGGAAVNPAAVLKPLFDGVISALHHHDDRASVDVVAARIAASGGLDRRETARLLSESETALFGGRRLAWPWRDGIQWNPADDRCMVGRLFLSSLPALRPWAFEADIYEIDPVEAI